MEKQAQKRSLMNKIKEYTNLGGLAAEKAPVLNNPGFKELMDQLREVDDEIRSILTGQAIGSASAPDDTASLKELLKGSKSNLNRREYMTAISLMGRFHSKLQAVVNIISGYNANVSGLHEKFLLEDLDDDVVTHLRSLQDRFSPKKANRQVDLQKEAGIMDFFVNIGTERGRALSAWEKRYPEKIKALKTATQKLVDKSEDVFGKVISFLKEMANFRAERMIDNYIKEANKIVTVYTPYDNLFKNYYDEYVKGFLDKLPKKETVNTYRENATQPFPGNIIPVTQPGNPPVFENSDVNTIPKTVPPPNTVLLHQNKTKTQPISSNQENVPPTDKTGPNSEMDEEYESDRIAREILSQKNKLPSVPGLGQLPANPFSLTEAPKAGITSAPPIPLKNEEIKVSHRDFFNTLKSMKYEDSEIVNSFVRKYATKIIKSDPTVAIQLINSLRWK
jgi:hypothetical protein